jgi:hypothetical protein
LLAILRGAGAQGVAAEEGVRVGIHGVVDVSRRRSSLDRGRGRGRGKGGNGAAQAGMAAGVSRL